MSLTTNPPRLVPRGALTLDAVSAGYQGKAIVHQVSANIEPGQVVAVLGPNGSGKSTLIRSMVGLAQVLGGRILVDGRPIEDARTRVGYVPQQHTLGDSVIATTTEVVTTGLLPEAPWYRPWVRRTEHNRERVAQAIATVGLADQARQPVRQLSGGQQRRVLIARALCAHPDVLVMDEPTAGVDYGSQAVLAQVLGRLAKQGTTMLIVTHELAALREIVDRVLVIENGQLVREEASA